MWVVSLLLAATLLARAAQPPTTGIPVWNVNGFSWSAVDAAISQELLTADLPSLLERAGKPTDPATALRILNLSLRAGNRQVAETTLPFLARVGTGNLPFDLPGLLLARKEVDLAARLLELAPQWRNFNVHQVAEQWRVAGRPPADIDRWLERGGWTFERVVFRSRLRTDGPLVAALVTDLRRGPCTRDALRQLISFVNAASAPVDLDWMSAWCQPDTATESMALGSSLAKTAPAAAIVLLQLALDLPFVEADVQYLRMPFPIPPRFTFEQWRRRFRFDVQLRLADTYRASGQVERAQALIERMSAEDPTLLADVRYGNTAGAVQAQSGARVIERRITDAGVNANDNSPDYWLTRASYFAERHEDASAVDAYEHALLAAHQPTSNAEQLQTTLRQYTNYLRQGRRDEDAWRLLRRELEAQIGPDRAEALIFDRLRDLASPVSVQFARRESEWIWLAVERRPSWPTSAPERSVGSLLSVLVNQSPIEARAALVERAVALAATGEPSRLANVADVLARNGDVRATGMYEQALKTMPPGQARDSLQRTLASHQWSLLQQRFDLQLRTGDWRAAERTWPELQRVRGRTPELPPFATLAASAARAGDIDDALRLWRMASNLDRTSDLMLLKELARTPLRDPLITFYRELKRQDAASWVPDAALRELGAIEPR